MPLPLYPVERKLSIPVPLRFHYYKIPNTYYLEYLLFGMPTIWNTYYLEYLLFGMRVIWNTLILYLFHPVSLVSLITYILQIPHCNLEQSIASHSTRKRSTYPLRWPSYGGRFRLVAVFRTTLLLILLVVWGPSQRWDSLEIAGERDVPECDGGIYQFLTRKLDFLMGLRGFRCRCPALA